MQQYELAAMRNRADRLAINPHNIAMPGCPALTISEYWRAVYEREGAQSAQEDCPYREGTLAATAWQRGKRFAFEIGVKGNDTSADEAMARKQRLDSRASCRLARH